MLRLSYALFFILIALRFLASLRLGLTVDEAHYVIYGQKLALSYFDHPPLVGWVQFIFSHLPVNENLQARLPALIISIITSWLVYKYLIKKKKNPLISTFAVLALNLTPLFNSLSMALLPDTLLMPLVILILDKTECLIEKYSLQGWLWLGFYLGLAGLSKYTAILFVPALVVIFIYTKNWWQLLKPGFWLGSLLAALLITPVLYWNYANDFISFKYQTNHVAGGEASLHLQSLISSFGIQLVSWGIAPFIMGFIYHLHLIVQFIKYKKDISILALTSVFLLFFISVAWNEVLLPHWMLVYFTIMVPFGFYYTYEQLKYKKTALMGLSLSGLLSFLLLTEAAFGVLPSRISYGLYHDIWGWPELIKEAQNKLTAITTTPYTNKKALAVMNWSLASRAVYYSYEKSEVFVLDHRSDQFDIWNPKSPIGYSLIILIEAEKKDEQINRLSCANLVEVGDKITKIKDIPVHHFIYYYCENLISVKD